MKGRNVSGLDLLSDHGPEKVPASVVDGSTEGTGGGEPNAGSGSSPDTLFESTALPGFHIPAEWQELYGWRAGFDAELQNVFFVDVLTVPDETLSPCPIDRSKYKPVDLSGLENATAEQVAKYVSGHLPDDQLQTLIEHEHRLAMKQNKPPRKACFPKLLAERNRRSPYFSDWVNEASRDVMRSRICAAAFAVGSADPVIMVEGMDGSECEILAALWNKSDGLIVASVDCLRVWNMVNLRSVFHDLEHRRTARVMRLESQMISPGLGEHAAALGLGRHMLLSPAEVFEAAKELSFKKLAAEMRKRFELNRLILCSESTMG